MMKKKFIQAFAIVLLLFVSNCQNEPYEGNIIIEDNSCFLVIQATADASINFSNANDDSYSLLCQIYRDALQEQIEVCGDEDASLQILLDNLGDCDNIDEEDQLCIEAIIATEMAENDLQNATDDNFEEVCLSYVNALTNQISLCGDDGSLQNIIDELGDCELEEIDVVGNWKLIAWNTDEERDIDNDGIATTNYLDDIDCYDNETILFNANGTGTMFFRSEADFTYTPNGGGEDFFTDCMAINEDKNFDWTETVNTVELSFADGTSLSLFKNGNLFVAVDDGFYAESTVDNSSITERVIFEYQKQ